MRSIFILVVISVIISPVYAWQSYIFEYEGTGVNAADYFNSLSPIKKFKEMKKTKTIGFVSVCGYTLITPGIEEFDTIQCLQDQKIGSYVIQGTSDSPKNKDDLEFNIAANNFAEKINRIVLEYIKENNLCLKTSENK